MIAVGGDIFANGHFYDGDRPISRTFEDVTAITGAADVVFANYEMPLSTRGQPIEKLANIRADPAIAPDIGRLGLDVVSLANNHMMDYGADALADTIANLDEQGIRHVGAGADARARPSSRSIVEVHGREDRLPRLHLPGRARRRRHRAGPGVAAIHVHSVVPDQSVLAGRGARRAGDGHDQDVRRRRRAGFRRGARARPARAGRLSLPLSALGLRRVCRAGSRSISGRSGTR